MNRDFTDSEGLRWALYRLHLAGPGAWRRDPEAAELMVYTMEKYGALARRHHREPEDAAAAAFDVMCTRAVRVAEDPWAVVTRAVQVTLIAEERAEGLLCSTMRARRPEVMALHDAERFSERQTPVTEFHPAFHVAAEQDVLIEHGDQNSESEGRSEEAPEPNAYVAADSAVAIFAALGWPEDTAKATIEYICARLIECGSRTTAHEMLRRDPVARALLDLDRTSWATALRIVLGSPNPVRSRTAAGRGLLFRLAEGYPPTDLMEDDGLVRAIHATAPQPRTDPRLDEGSEPERSAAHA